MMIEFKYRVKKLISQYKTRKQLLNLPSYLLKDVAITSEQQTKEVKKNSAVNVLRQLIKGD